MEKRWYVFDKEGCFNSYAYDEAGAAMDEAVGLQRDGFDSAHVVCMTAAQAAEYSKTGDLKKAYAIK